MVLVLLIVIGYLAQVPSGSVCDPGASGKLDVGTIGRDWPQLCFFSSGLPSCGTGRRGIQGLAAARRTLRATGRRSTLGP